MLVWHRDVQPFTNKAWCSQLAIVGGQSIVHRVVHFDQLRNSYHWQVLYLVRHFDLCDRHGEVTFDFVDETNALIYCHHVKR